MPGTYQGATSLEFSRSTGCVRLGVRPRTLRVSGCADSTDSASQVFTQRRALEAAQQTQSRPEGRVEGKWVPPRRNLAGPLELKTFRRHLLLLLWPAALNAQPPLMYTKRQRACCHFHRECLQKEATSQTTEKQSSSPQSISAHTQTTQAGERRWQTGMASKAGKSQAFGNISGRSQAVWGPLELEQTHTHTKKTPSSTNSETICKPGTG